VIDLELSWHQAAAAVGVLGIATVALRRASRPRLIASSVFTQETALVLALFALWQYAGSFAVLGPGGALARSRWIWHAERLAHLPSEVSVQQIFLPHPLLVQFFNLYYDSLHFPVLITCMVWLFVRHRDSYRRLRTTLVAFTGACLLVQLVPVAPPRMLTGTGLVDTAVVYHQSVYATTAGFDPDELSAMPSVHVGWAVLVAVAVIITVRSRWRWLALLYPAMTTLAVVVTANHFWLDGIVAAALLGLVLLIQIACRRALAGATATTTAAASATTGASRSPERDSGLSSARPTWDASGNNDPTVIRGNNGDTSTRSGISGAPAERDRSA
jgi:hypothetical protein